MAKQKRATKIMVVEDSTQYQDAVMQLLLTEPSTKDVHIAASGEEGLEKFSQVSPDLVILDSKPESTEGRPLGQPLKKPACAPLNLG